MNTRDDTRHAERRPRIALLAAALLISTLHCAPAQGGDTFKLKNRSLFGGTQVARDPFWPIGWKKDSRLDPQAPAEVEITADEFVVTSILLSPPALALINGKEYGEGEFVVVPGSAAKAQVAAIQDGTVVLIYHGKTVTAALRRNEHLSTPKRDDPAYDANASRAEAIVTPH